MCAVFSCVQTMVGSLAMSASECLGFLTCALMLLFSFLFWFCCCCCCCFVLPSTSLWGVYSETFIRHYNILLAHAFTRLCMTCTPCTVPLPLGLCMTCTPCTMPLPLGHSVHVHPALSLFPLVTVYTIFDFKLCHN